MNEYRQALDRTTLLLNQEFFDGRADHELLAEALAETRVGMHADQDALLSRAGQSALVTAFMLVARLGIGIELEIPNPPVIDRVAPLRRAHMRDALLELGADLIPGGLIGTGERPSESQFSIGSSPRSPQDIVVSIGEFDCSLERGGRARCEHGNSPFGGFVAGAAVAGVALEAAIPAMEAATGLEARTPRPFAGPPVSLNLLDLFPTLSSAVDLEPGEIDVISGGAITNAMLFCLLRTPQASVGFRLIEADVADLSNLNRYALLRASELGMRKTDILERLGTSRISIRGIRSLFTSGTRKELRPLSERVLVGVDDVEARWWVQEEKPQWLAVGATGNHLAQLTTHTRQSPCAGCLHPVALAPQVIPTISFVSFWAGLLQSCALMCPTAEPANVCVFPFALGGPMPWTTSALRPTPSCPVNCDQSRSAATDAIAAS